MMARALLVHCAQIVAIATIATSYAQPEVGFYAQPEDAAYTQSEVATYTQPEVAAYTQPEVGSYAQPEVGSYAQPEVSSHAQPEVRSDAQPEVGSYAQPEVSSHAQPEVRSYAQPEVGSYAQPEVGSYAQPEVGSYARVSINGARPLKPEVAAGGPANQARGFLDSTISRSPVYVPPSASKLRNGEVVDHPSTKRYSTLDREAVAVLDSAKSPKVAQDRFVPHANPQGAVNDPKYPVPGYATLPQAVYSSSYDRRPPSKPADEKPPSPPGGDFSADSEDSYAKIPDSYQQPEIYAGDEPADAPRFPVYRPSVSYGDKYPPKPADFPADFDDSYGPHDDDHHDFHHHDLIYDNPPDHDLDHHHHHHHHRRPTTTTEEPEVNDQRLSKRPYSYYYIGKKLWYIPLYFSIYFIIYIAALILKSIARHKINFPASLAAAADRGRLVDDRPGWLDLAKRVFDGIDMYNSLRETLDPSSTR